MHPFFYKFLKVNEAFFCYLFGVFLIFSFSCKTKQVRILTSALEHYNKPLDSLRIEFINKYFYVKGLGNRGGGGGVSLTPGSRVKCTDVIIDSTTYEGYRKFPMKSLVLQSDLESNLKLTVQSAKNWLYTSEENKYYKTKYGNKKWQKILAGNLEMDWDSTACVLALGKPTRICKIDDCGPTFVSTKEYYKFEYDEFWETRSRYEVVFFIQHKVVAYEYYYDNYTKKIIHK